MSTHSASSSIMLPAGMTDADGERYCEDRLFRLKTGPSLELWGEFGHEESLYGLVIDLDFGRFGTCHGHVRGDKVCTGGALDVVWTCGSKGGDEYEYHSVLLAEQVVGLYCEGRSCKFSDWAREKYPIDECSHLFSIPLEASLVNVHLPAAFSGMFSPNDGCARRWRLTERLLNNDTDFHSDAYPPAFALTAMIACKHAVANTRLPVVVTDENRPVIQLANEYARTLGSASGNERMLMALEKMVAGIYSGLTRGNKKVYQPTNIADWTKDYQKCQALMLTLSKQYQTPFQFAWRAYKNKERVFKVIEDLLDLWCHVYNPVGMTVNVDRDQVFNALHLKEGTFMDIVMSTEFQDSTDARVYSAVIFRATVLKEGPSMEEILKECED